MLHANQRVKSEGTTFAGSPVVQPRAASLRLNSILEHFLSNNYVLYIVIIPCCVIVLNCVFNSRHNRWIAVVVTR